MTPALPKHLLPFCGAFLVLLDRWNRTHALTSLPPALRREELLLDSAVLLPWLERLEPGARVVDFGTGMGIPALLLAAARPDLRILAVDRSRKKRAFVRQVAMELGLSNLKALAEDAGDLPPLDASLGTAKAVGSLSLLLGWWDRHGRQGAPFLAMKGPGSAGDDPPPGWSLARHPYQLPTRGERVLLEARRNGGEGGTGLA